MEVDDEDYNKYSRKGEKSEESSEVAPLSLAVMESLTLPLVQEVVLSADLSCVQCQKRINDVISRINAETESITVSLCDKKVGITCKYIKASKTQINLQPWQSKVALIKWIFGSSRP
ncbi:hypothetical protein RND81_11G059400 [Saponaria officinalis]|uniref:HMA domain-containing protein n=1 Tax=Saponaria officinalis TaxID=3572 RepID=A0AAW1HK37_SAPOF